MLDCISVGSFCQVVGVVGMRPCFGGGFVGTKPVIFYSSVTSYGEIVICYGNWLNCYKMRHVYVLGSCDMGYGGLCAV